MATKMEVEVKNQELKHLGFVRVAAIQALVCVSNLYEYAKPNSGPLRSLVGTVENTVSSVLGPVYQKFKDIPNDLLVFVDNKVDVATEIFDVHAPPFAKQVASQTKCLIQKVSDKTEKLVKEARSGGPRAAVHQATNESKQFLLTQTVKLWTRLDHYPPFHAVAETAVPTAAHLSDKYNHVIKDMTEKGYTVAGYLPLIPIDKIAKAFKQGDDEVAPQKRKSESSDSDSD
ncbi:hypothetical protein L6164_010743 [Bauhinia variegata]|uniref:Uncharacterized protein n=1 Tax=Bauhinia variegata TaxID=167791 RepID=A0ACB9P3B7_BAUVA|nr:hypothetical protein L6164_010743 [Bauhinia variegata]